MADIALLTNELAEVGHPPSYMRRKTPLRMSVTLYNAIIRSGAEFIGWVVISPELADVMLSNNPANRKISAKTTVPRFSSLMSCESWEENGETIKVAITGELNDGQNRLMACVSSNKQFVTLLVMGLARESRESVDIGRIKTIADVLKMHNPNRNDPIVLALACRNILMYVRHKTMDYRPEIDPDHAAIKAFLDDNPELETDEWYFNRARALREPIKVFHLGGWLALVWVFGRISRAKADEFIDSLIDGANLASDDPRLVLRNYLLAEQQPTGRGSKKKMQKSHLYAAIIKAWNAFVLGKPMKRQGRSLSWTKQGKGAEDFPTALPVPSEL